MISEENFNTVLLNQKLKAILSENLNVLQEYVLTDRSEVKFLRSANIKEETQINH